MEPKDNVDSEDTNVLAVKVSEEFRNSLPTGNLAYDKMFSFEADGIKRTSVNLVTGRAGAGKTTWLQQLADSLSMQENCHVVYDALEQSKEQIKVVAERLQLTTGFDLRQIADFDDLLAFCIAEQAAKPNEDFILIIDSLQYVKLKGFANKLEKQKEILHRLRKWANDTHAIVFVVGMVGKDGNYLGSGELEHIIDIWIELYTVVKRNAKNYGKRCLTMRKNRNGVAGVDYPYTISERGLKFALEIENDKKAGLGEQVSLKAKAKELIENIDPMNLLTTVSQAANKVNQIFNAASKISKLFGGNKKRK